MKGGHGGQRDHICVKKRRKSLVTPGGKSASQQPSPTSPQLVHVTKCSKNAQRSRGTKEKPLLRCELTTCLPPPLFTCMNELNPLFLKEEEKRQKLQSYIWRTPLPIPPVLKMKKKDRVAERFAINRTFCDYLHSIVVRNSVITSLRLSLSGGQ